MKIIYIANARIPTEKAHGIQIFKTCEALCHAGTDLELWIPERRNPRLKNIDPFEYYNVKNKFKIVKHWSLDLIGSLDFFPGLAYWIQSKTFAWNIARQFKQLDNKKSIVYSRDAIPLEPVRKARLLYFFEAHTISDKPSEFYKRIFREASGIITISKSLAEEFFKYTSQDKILVAPDGVDLEKFKIQNTKFKSREMLGLPQDKKIVIYTGHLYDWKGADTLLQAAKQYLISNIKYPTLFIFVGGTDHDLRNFREKAKGLDNVLIVGQRSHSEIPMYLAAADVLVLPNSGKFKISRSHTSPLKLFEYMASNRPIIASDLPSLREILDETTATFFSADDPEDLAKRINEVLSHIEVTNGLTKKALQVVQKYSWANRGEAIINFMRTHI